MTATLDPKPPVEEPAEGAHGHSLDGFTAEASEATHGNAAAELEEETPLELRPLLASALAATSAALTAGGIFGSLTARLVGVLGVVVGASWVWLCARSRRPQLAQVALLPVCLGVSALSILPHAPGELVPVVRAAVHAGRLLRPPVPFDAGWRPLLFTLMAMLAFVGGWVATSLRRPTLAIALPLPIAALTAITQPSESQVTAGVLAFAPVLVAFTILFTGDSNDQLSRSFEIKRALRSIALGVPALAALIALGNAPFLFPKPVYDPTNQPQKPRSAPLSAARDRVLFEVATDSAVTGPWRTGVLDVYDGRSWRLPPFDANRLHRVPASGQVIDERSNEAYLQVNITVRDLGDSSVLPVLPTTTNFIGGPASKRYDPRTGVFRLPRGRVPAGTTYQLLLPKYPTGEQLTPVSRVDRKAFASTLAVPRPPKAVADILASAPASPAWARLAYVRQRLYDVASASGAGAPADVTNATVTRMLTGNHEGTPFEIVAVDAMLARWAGVPSRIAFGFDGLNVEAGDKGATKGTLTVRPRNAAQWMEAYFEGYGWVPLIQTPDKAKATLDSDPNARFNPQIEASSDIAVEVYMPVEVRDARELFQLVRARLLQALPWLLALVAMWLAFPAAAKALRRRRRRQWAATRGPRARVVVEYAEFRDAATDLNVGDPFDTPLEYLLRVQDDAQHAELAWLVARVLYGDMTISCSEHDARQAEELARSLRLRMARAQPMQARAFAVLGRASLRRPYSTELPTVQVPRIRQYVRIPSMRRRRPRAKAHA
jgi:transglutaminase-like putative cysteine protease